MNRFSYVLFCLLCIIVLFQDIIGISLFQVGIPGIFLKFLLSFKDLLIFLIIIFNLMLYVTNGKHISLNATLFFFSGYLLFVIFYFFYFDNPGKNFNDLRALIFPIYTYLAGYTSFYLKKDKAIKFIGGLTLFSVLISLAVYFLGPDFLVKLKVLDFTVGIRGYYGLIFNNLPSTFFGNFANFTFYRLAGPVLNPIGTATLFSFIFAILYSFYRKGHKDFVLKVTIASLILAILLTFSRGPIIGLIVGIVITNIMWGRRIKLSNQLFLYLVFITLSIILYNIFSIIIKETIQLRDSSSIAHLTALMKSWGYINLNWLGTGIGSTGQWNSDISVAGVGENSFAMIIGQVGIVSFVFLMAAYLSIFKNILVNKQIELNYGMSIFFVAYLFNAMFCATLLTVTPAMLFWFFIGFLENKELVTA